MDNYHRVVWEDTHEIINASLPWETLQDKTVLITGANGFISTYLVYTLLSLNDIYNTNVHIVGMVRDICRARERFFDVINRDDFEIIVQDVCEPIIYKSNVDFIFHSAANATPATTHSNPIGTLRTSYLGTDNVLSFASEKNASMVYLSSYAVYGENRPGTDENSFGSSDCFKSGTCYTESKRIGEALCQAYFSSNKAKIFVARIGTVIGPGITIGGNHHISDFLSNVLEQKNIVVYSDGTPVRSYISTNDLTIALFTMLIRGQHGNVYNVSSENLTIQNIAELFLTHNMNSDARITHIINPSHKSMTGVQDATIDANRLKNAGWEPSTTIRTAIRRMIDCYRV